MLEIFTIEFIWSEASRHWKTIDLYTELDIKIQSYNKIFMTKLFFVLRIGPKVLTYTDNIAEGILTCNAVELTIWITKLMK